MFTEFLRIVPKLSPADANKMEHSLTKRFTKVGKTFSKTLKNAVKGSVLGLGLAFLAQLLNPLRELEERLKDMLGKGADINEEAAKYGTSAGALRTLQAAAATQGVAPDKLSPLLDSFAKAVETAKAEIAESARDPSKTISAASSAVSRFVNEGDQAEAFFKFVQSLKAYGAKAGIEQRQNVERAVFGEKLYGNTRKFIESDMSKIIGGLGGPKAAEITKGVEKLADLDRLRTAREVFNDTENLLGTSKALTPGIVGQMLERERAALAKERAEISDYQKLVKAAEAISGLASIVKEIKGAVIEGLGLLREIQQWLSRLLPSLPSLPKIKGHSFMDFLFNTTDVLGGRK